MSEKTVLVTREERVQCITLNRPQKLNSFTDEMHLALREALQQAAGDADCGAIVLTGSGKGFCAGQDLGDRDPAKMDGPPDLAVTLTNFYNPLVLQIRSIAKPVICAVNGVAAGAGANVALACDIVLAARSARFIQSFARVGLIPDAGGCWMLPRLVGEARAKAIAMTARPVDAEQAEQWGMIWQCVEDADLPGYALDLATQLANGATFGLGLMKTTMQDAAQRSLEEHLPIEAQMQRKAGHSADYAEGVSAFLHKRKPVFTGK